jgi:hypothetical protein
VVDGSLVFAFCVPYRLYNCTRVEWTKTIRVVTTSKSHVFVKDLLGLNQTGIVFLFVLVHTCVEIRRLNYLGRFL